jgi:hypothetical protein
MLRTLSVYAESKGYSCKYRLRSEARLVDFRGFQAWAWKDSGRELGVFRDMEKWCEIRQRVLREGESIRQIQRETGLHFETVKKILSHSSPPAFQTPGRAKPKLGPYLGQISAIIEADQELPCKATSYGEADI